MCKPRPAANPASRPRKAAAEPGVVARRRLSAGATCAVLKRQRGTQLQYDRHINQAMQPQPVFPPPPGQALTGAAGRVQLRSPVEGL